AVGFGNWAVIIFGFRVFGPLLTLNFCLLFRLALCSCFISFPFLACLLVLLVISFGSQACSRRTPRRRRKFIPRAGRQVSRRHAGSRRRPLSNRPSGCPPPRVCDDRPGGGAKAPPRRILAGRRVRQRRPAGTGGCTRGPCHTTRAGQPGGELRNLP